MEGRYLPGDLFLFATDALACWFLRECEAGLKPWLALMEPTTQLEFGELIGEFRRAGSIRNDDVTMVRIVVSRSQQTLMSSAVERGPES